MPYEQDHDRIERAERWALMEWILVGGRRWWLLVFVLLMLAMSAAIGILYADGVSHLNHKEFRTFVRRQEEMPHPYGPLFERVHQ
jgi:hypothetical protein